MPDYSPPVRGSRVRSPSLSIRLRRAMRRPLKLGRSAIAGRRPARDVWALYAGSCPRLAAREAATSRGSIRSLDGIAPDPLRLSARRPPCARYAPGRRARRSWKDLEGQLKLFGDHQGLTSPVRRRSSASDPTFNKRYLTMRKAPLATQLPRVVVVTTARRTHSGAPGQLDTSVGPNEPNLRSSTSNGAPAGAGPYLLFSTTTDVKPQWLRLCSRPSAVPRAAPSGELIRPDGSCGGL